MSPRRNRRVNPAPLVRRPSRALDAVQSWPDGEWVVRELAGSSESKRYRCPGCDQEIPAAVPHVVCWPAESGGVEYRRHWHRPCWQARLRRTPRALRSRGGPRF